MLHSNYNLVPLLKGFTDNVLKCKALLKTNFKCVCVTMCSLAMSFFSRDYIKTEISISNVLTYLNVFSIHTAPSF